MTITPKIVVFSILASILVIAGYTQWTTRNTPLSQVKTQPPSSAFDTKENTGGNVTVIVTPQELGTGKPAVFQIVFDTHSVNLDSDVAQASALRDDQGNTYGTPAWKGDPPGGHHRKGTLSFPTPLKQIPAISLILKDIAGVQERTFVWKL